MKHALLFLTLFALVSSQLIPGPPPSPTGTPPSPPPSSTQSPPPPAPSSPAAQPAPTPSGSPAQATPSGSPAQATPSGSPAQTTPAPPPATSQQPSPTGASPAPSPTNAPVQASSPPAPPPTPSASPQPTENPPQRSAPVAACLDAAAKTFASCVSSSSAARCSCVAAYNASVAVAVGCDSNAMAKARADISTALKMFQCTGFSVGASINASVNVGGGSIGVGGGVNVGVGGGSPGQAPASGSGGGGLSLCAGLDVAFTTCGIRSLKDINSPALVVAKVCNVPNCKNAMITAAASLSASANIACSQQANTFSNFQSACARLEAEASRTPSPTQTPPPSTPAGCPTMSAAMSSTACAGIGGVVGLSSGVFNEKAICKPSCFAALLKASASASPSSGRTCGDEVARFNAAAESQVQICSIDQNDNACPNGTRPTPCLLNPCAGARCPKSPNAKCIPNYCGGCMAEFFLNGEKVDQCYDSASVSVGVTVNVGAGESVCGSNKCSANQYCCNRAASKCVTRGQICERPAPPPECPTNAQGQACSGNGQCPSGSAFCNCNAGFYGNDCSMNKNQTQQAQQQRSAWVQVELSVRAQLQTQTTTCNSTHPVFCGSDNIILPSMRNKCAASRGDCVDLSTIAGARFDCEVLNNNTFCGTTCVPFGVSCTTALPPLPKCAETRCATGGCSQNGVCPAIASVELNPCLGNPDGEFSCDGVTCARNAASCAARVKWNGCPTNMIRCNSNQLVCVNSTSQCEAAVGCPAGQVDCGVKVDANGNVVVRQGIAGEFRPAPICKASCSAVVSNKRPEPKTQTVAAGASAVVEVKAAAEGSASSATTATVAKMNVAANSLRAALDASQSVDLVVSAVADSQLQFGSFANFQSSGAISSSVIDITPSVEVDISAGLTLDIPINAETETGAAISEAECLARLNRCAPYSSNNMSDTAGAQRSGNCTKGTASPCSCMFQLYHFTSYAVMDQSAAVAVTNAKVESEQSTPAPSSPTASTASIVSGSMFVAVLVCLVQVLMHTGW